MTNASSQARLVKKSISEPLGIESLTQIPIGDVRAFLCRDVIGILTWLETFSVTNSITLRVVAPAWDQLPDHSAVVTDTLTAIAKASHAIWPSWYGQENFLAAGTTLEQRIRSHSQAAICEPWAKAAVHACKLGQLPLLSKFSNSLQLSQLALTIGPDKLVIIFAVKDSQPEFKLFGFAKAADWIAKETGSRVAVLIPTDLADHEALASILYGAVEIAPALPSLPTEVINGEESKHFFWRQGKPHAESPGEQKLADRLSRDDELATLFWFNQSVKTVRDSLYLVDLLWPEGKVIVEIDGYKHHSARLTFSADRNRDYELLISDYIVLRLPHHEVVSDIEIAVEKIRDVVRFRRQQLNEGEI